MTSYLSETLQMRAHPSFDDDRVERAIRRAGAALKIAAFEAYRHGEHSLADACATIVIEIEDLGELAKVSRRSSYDPRPGPRDDTAS